MSVTSDLAVKTNGKKWTVTGADAGQCTAIPHQLQTDLGLGIVYGNAKDTYANAPDSLYIKAQNTASYVPIEGAIGVSKVGDWGHTWVILSGTDVNTQHLLEQNNPVGAVTRIISRDYSGVFGYFTPRAIASAPAQPTPTPVDVPDADDHATVNGQGLHGHTQPNLSSPWPWFFDDNEHIVLLARTKGENVTTGPYAPSEWWYLARGNGSPDVWVSDAYVRTTRTPANVPDWNNTPATPDPTPVNQYSPRPATGIFGVDVSSVGQGKIDWDKLVSGEQGSGIDFAVARAGHVGKSFGGDDNARDPQFDFNRSEALRLGVPFGAYWFCYPALDPKDEAQKFANVVSSVEDSESLWADIETNPVDGDMDLIEWCKIFKAEVERLTNHKCRGYYNQDFHDRYPGLKEVFGSDGVWAAHYGKPAEARPFDEAIMHQYSSSGVLPGITGKVDLNVFFGTKDEFKALGRSLSLPQPPTPTGTPGVDNGLGDHLNAQDSVVNQILVIILAFLNWLVNIFKKKG